MKVQHAGRALTRPCQALLLQAGLPQVAVAVPLGAVSLDQSSDQAGHAARLDDLIADYARAPIGRMGTQAVEPQAPLGSGHEEGAGLVEARQAFEIEVAAIHDIEGAGFDDELIEDIDVVELAIADMQEGWDVGTALRA